MTDYTPDSLRALFKRSRAKRGEWNLSMLEVALSLHADAWQRQYDEWRSLGRRLEEAEIDVRTATANWEAACNDFVELEGQYAALREQYNQLICAVETKHEGESRHETALRYIREAEYKGRDVAALASRPESET